MSGLLMIGLGGLLLILVSGGSLLWRFRHRNMPIDATKEWEDLQFVAWKLNRAC